MIIDLKVRAAVDRMFRKVGGRRGESVENPVTGGRWVRGVDSQKQQKQEAYLALLARLRFRYEGPIDAPLLPLTSGQRQDLKGRGGLFQILAWYAESLVCMHYDFSAHIPFEDYARGVMASPYAPDYITGDEELKRRFPPKPLKNLKGGLVWYRD